MAARTATAEYSSGGGGGRRQPDDDGDDDLSAANSSHSKLVASIGNAKQRSYIAASAGRARERLGNEGKNKIRGVDPYIRRTFLMYLIHCL